MTKNSAENAQSSIEVEVRETNEQWSQYVLSDGTTIRLRPVLISVLRIEGKYLPDGEPIYNFKSTIVVDVRAPKHLKSGG